MRIGPKGLFTLTRAETETNKKRVVRDCVEVFTDRDRYSEWCQWVLNPLYRSQSRSLSLSLSVWTHHNYCWWFVVSLCRASMVCRVWHQLANDVSLWRRFCSQPKWQLSRAGEQKQLIQHILPNGNIHVSTLRAGEPKQLILSVTMSIAGEYQKILTEDKGLGAGIHRGHRPRWIPAPRPLLRWEFSGIHWQQSLWRFYPMRKISSAWINAEKAGEYHKNTKNWYSPVKTVFTCENWYSPVNTRFWQVNTINVPIPYVSLCLCVQNVVPAQPCVGKIRISLVLLNFLHCNFRLWFETP